MNEETAIVLCDEAPLVLASHAAEVRLFSLDM